MWTCDLKKITPWCSCYILTKANRLTSSNATLNDAPTSENPLPAPCRKAMLPTAVCPPFPLPCAPWGSWGTKSQAALSGFPEQDPSSKLQGSTGQWISFSVGTWWVCALRAGRPDFHLVSLCSAKAAKCKCPHVPHLEKFTVYHRRMDTFY